MTSLYDLISNLFCGLAAIWALVVAVILFAPRRANRVNDAISSEEKLREVRLTEVQGSMSDLWEARKRVTYLELALQELGQRHQSTLTSLNIITTAHETSNLSELQQRVIQLEYEGRESERKHQAALTSLIELRAAKDNERARLQTEWSQAQVKIRELRKSLDDLNAIARANRLLEFDDLRHIRSVLNSLRHEVVLLSLSRLSADEVELIVPDPAESFYDQALNDIVQASFNVVTEREREVLIRRFGFGEFVEPQTLAEIAESLGVSVETVRRDERKALRKLRHPMRSRRLRDFLR